MRIVLSTGEVIFCFCSFVLALYLSPFFIDEVNANASNAWEFLLIWDDRENFLENEVIQSGLSLENLYSMFTMAKINVYEPFGWILKAIQVQIVGLDSWSIRLVSVALHFIAAVVLARSSALLLNMMMLLSDFKTGVNIDGKIRQQRERSHWYGCCISAVIFATHPVHVEVVGWPSAQPYTLCALFSNLTVYVYIHVMYRRLRGVLLGQKNVKKVLMSSIFGGHARSDLLCCGLYLSALLSKSVCIFIPVGFFLVDMMVYATLQPHLPIPKAKDWWSYIIGKVPVSATMLTFLAVMLVSNYNGMHPDTDVLSLTLGQRMLKSITMPIWVLRRILWPTKLRPHYQLRPNELNLTNSEYLLSLSASIVVALFTFWLFRHRRAPQHLLALAFFSIMVLPVSGLIQHGMVSAGCDRYAYLCSVVAVPYGGSMLAQYCFSSEENDSNILKCEGLKDDGSNGLEDLGSTKLWELAYHFTPMGTLKADLQRLKLLIALNQVDRACENYEKLLELRPDNCHVHNNVGVCLIRRGELLEARREFERALQTPGYEQLYDAPRKNLVMLEKLIVMKEDAQARGEEGTGPDIKTTIMF
ncbi:hypothetical protein PHMEG_00015761 [Phytophthora megakarya]|uniref:Uncharacterized protein n=1 Tax=Phytophthora megakarya TaxID=4795 RepID=A0A225W206_9STRA|nr:hypothetical protein PHMEG_00015761 [Phytophthora megakarya]